MPGEEGKKIFDPLADVVAESPYIDKDRMAKEIMEMLRGMPRLKGNLRKGANIRRNLFQNFKARVRSDG